MPLNLKKITKKVIQKMIDLTIITRKEYKEYHKKDYQTIEIR